MSAKLTWALSASRDLTSISDVSSGNQCGCFCPECGAELTAKKGWKNAHHFAHTVDSDCTGGVETAIHLLAKEIIATEMKICLPGTEAIYPFLAPVLKKDLGYIKNQNPFSYLESALKPSQTYYLNPFESSGFELNGLLAKVSEIIPSKSVDIDHVRVEERLENIVPDIIATINGQDVLIEIANTHFIDDTKLKKIRAHAWPTIEIDVSDIGTVDFEEIRSRILFPSDNSKWIFYSKELEHDLATRAEIRLEEMLLEMQYEFLEKKKKIAREEEDRKARAIKAKSDKEEYERADELTGLPKLQGSEKQINWARTARQKRTNRFSHKDKYVQGIRRASEWIKCDKKGQLLYPVPFYFEEIFKEYPCQEALARREPIIPVPVAPFLTPDKPSIYKEPVPFQFSDENNSDCGKCGIKKSVITRNTGRGRVTICLHCLDENNVLDGYEDRKKAMISRLPKNCPACKIGKMVLKELYWEADGIFLYCNNCKEYES
jgi:hypothetical protein